jgi:hypothetical protein
MERPCLSRRRPARTCSMAAIIAAIVVLGNCVPATAAESITRRIPGGAVAVSTPLSQGIWLHTEVKRVRLLCSTVATKFGREGRPTTHFFEAFTTTGSDPNGRRLPVERLRLTSTIGEDPARVKDCHGAELCGAIYEDGCRRSCAHAEAWEHGEHATTAPACLERR